MRKFLLAILIVLVLSPQVWATDYFACVAGEIHDNNVWCTAAHANGSCSNDGTTEADTAAILIAGNSFYANGCAMTITSNFTVTKISTEANGETAGGSFTVNVNTNPGLTFTTNITGATTDGLTITGAAAAGTALTIKGNITGSSTTNSKYGVNDSHTGATSIIDIQGDISAGTNSSGHGYYHSGATGYFVITGSCTGVNGAGFYTGTGTSGSTISGNCTGSDVVTTANGCYFGGVGGYTVAGNINNGLRANGAYGAVSWVPSNAQKYTFYKYGTGIYASAGLGSNAGGTQITGANTAAKVANDSYFVKKDDGVYTIGTHSAGVGGGAWGF